MLFRSPAPTEIPAEEESEDEEYIKKLEELLAKKEEEDEAREAEERRRQRQQLLASIQNEPPAPVTQTPVQSEKKDVIQPEVRVIERKVEGIQPQQTHTNQTSHTNHIPHAMKVEEARPLIPPALLKGNSAGKKPEIDEETEKKPEKIDEETLEEKEEMKAEDHQTNGDAVKPKHDIDREKKIKLFESLREKLAREEEEQRLLEEEQAKKEEEEKKKQEERAKSNSLIHLCNL